MREGRRPVGVAGRTGRRGWAVVGGVGRSGWLWGVLGDPGVLWVAWGVLGVWRVRLGGSFLPKGRASFISPTPEPRYHKT
jgi:hypothetical protein